MQQSQKGLAQFLIPRGHAAQWFAFVEAPFHLLAYLVEGFLIVYGLSPLALGRSHGHDGRRAELLSAALTGIPLVHDRRGQRLLRRPRRAHGRKDRTRIIPEGVQSRLGAPLKGLYIL